MKKMDLGIKNKTAIVTGGSRGVGKEIALTLANEGANVVVTYQSNREKADEVVKAIEATGQKGLAIHANLANADDAVSIISQSIKAFGTLDILVNNAAIWPTGYVKSIKLEDWNTTLDVNLTSVFLTSQAFLNHCLEIEQPGEILNITSQAAFHGSTTGHSHYAASKAGMIAFTKSMAREHAKDGIRVNNLALGIVETDMIREKLEKDASYYVNRIPLGRVAQPGDIADIAAFLVSKRAGYITGATIDATGGMLMR